MQVDCTITISLLTNHNTLSSQLSQWKQLNVDRDTVHQGAEMSDIMSDYVNYTEKSKGHTELVVEIYDSIDDITEHAVKEETEATDIKKCLQTEHTGRQAFRHCYPDKLSS